MIDRLTDQQRRWLEDYCNGSISSEDFVEFEQALIECDEFRRLGRRYLVMDSHLQEGAGAIEEFDQIWGDGKISSITSNPTGFRKIWLPLTAAATILFFLGMGLGSNFGWRDSAGEAEAEMEDDGIAVIQYANDAVWEDSEVGEIATGTILSPGPLKLKEGVASLEFYNGARLLLEGPVDLNIESVDRVIFHRGKLRAFVPENARGFSVLSSRFELVDLGTEFGVEIGPRGKAEVQVFDGEVELYPPNGLRSADQSKLLVGGGGMVWGEEGDGTPISSSPDQFPSFQETRDRNQIARKRGFERWRSWNEEVANDPRILVHYDFEQSESSLIDRGTSQLHGMVVGSERSTGRWPEKEALEFKRPGDRVRVDLPGEFDALTLAAWVRVDALPARRQALLLTDEYQLGRVHWQIGLEGELRFGMRVQRNQKNGAGSSGYSSPVLFSPRRIGTWTFVCSSYDREEGVVKHFLNGREVSQHEIIFDQPVQIGAGDIGNWSMPLKSKNKSLPVRNFVGRIDGMTIWKTALSGKEILETYKKTRP